MQPSLEKQLDLAHKWLAAHEAKSLRNRGDSSHPAHVEVKVCQALIATVERAIGCRDCAESDWPEEKGVQSAV